MQRGNNLWIVNSEPGCHPYLEVNQHQIIAMNILDNYRYLGADIGPKLKYAPIGKKIQNKLRLISRVPLRISRYHPEINTYCDSGCGTFECLDHIFQVCPGIDSARRERHNNLVRQLEKKPKLSR